jgi:FixJ family two-component response regulator
MPPQTEPICILDDDSSMRRSIKQLLNSDDLSALSFEDAEDFLAHVRSCPVPLAVLDVWLPNTSGLEVQARLKEMSPNTKVILITGRETPAVRAAALENGAFALVVKPFDDDEFLSLIRKALSSAA